MGYSNRWYDKNTENYIFFGHQCNSKKLTKCANFRHFMFYKHQKTQPSWPETIFDFTVNEKWHFPEMMTSSKFELVQNNPVIISHNSVKFLDMTNLGSKSYIFLSPPGLRSTKKPRLNRINLHETFNTATSTFILRHDAKNGR